MVGGGGPIQVTDCVYDKNGLVGSGGHCIMDNTRDYLPGS